MISRRPRAFALALVSTIVLAACGSEPESGTTATGVGGSATASSSTAGAGGSGGVGGSSAETSSATSSNATASSTVTATATSTTAATSTSSSSTSGAGGGATCADEIDAELAMETMGLLYPSESDYPFETVNLADPQGSGAITPAHLLDLLAMDPQLATETRTIPMFFANLLAGSDGAQYQLVLDTLQMELTDLTVIRIVPAAPFSAQIHVYVVGRTACGEIAGITTVSIET